MKKNIILLLSLFILTGCENDNNSNTTYKIKLNKEPYVVCGKKIYFSDNSYENEISIEQIIETIKEECNINGSEMAKEEIEDILSTQDYSKEEILYHLRDAYDYLKK